MKHDLLNNDEPLTDEELFDMLRDSFNDDEACWYIVREAQACYRQTRKELVIQEIEEERRNRSEDAA